MALVKRNTRDLRAPYALILVFAPAGWGKTFLIRTLKSLPLPPLVAATELGQTNGLLSLRTAEVDFVKIDTADDLTELYTKLAPNATWGGTKYGTLVEDSFTQLGELWGEAGRSALGLGDEPLTGGHVLQYFGYIAEKGRKQYKDATKLPMNIVLICREGQCEEGKGEDRITWAAPELPGQKLARELPGWPDATLRGVVHMGQRAFHTQTVGKVVSRIRNDGVRIPKYIKADLGLLIPAMLEYPPNQRTWDALEIKPLSPGKPANPSVRVQPAPDAGDTASVGSTI